MPRGIPERGIFNLDVTIAVPPATGSAELSDRQKDAIAIFYEKDLGALTQDQAQVLLGSRDFAMASVRAILPKYIPKAQAAFARAVAGFILADAEAVSFVVRWSDNAFKRGSTNPRVKGTALFTDIQSFIDYLQGMLVMEGWQEETFRSGYTY